LYIEVYIRRHSHLERQNSLALAKDCADLKQSCRFQCPVRKREKMATKTGNDLFIVDNSDEEWRVLNYLAEWSEISHKFDIATGYFEIGALLALHGKWQKLDQIRILMGDDVTKRTHRALIEGLARIGHLLDDSIEREKQKNDFLTGVDEIVQAITGGKIKCRVYAKKKFHAKAYITHSKLAVVGSSALVGSSNFTFPGLTGNVELNVQLRREVEAVFQTVGRRAE
jgi:phosphatidylserine/phosphatidylglycerophosphate/cardiolipin synthase-like enzyme